jgi:hAT family C-terminal dimerisation region
MSEQTAKEMNKEEIVMTEHVRSDLEVVLAFDQFTDVKTSRNIGKWLELGHYRAGVKPEMISCHSTDGASNAVGSVLEFRAITDYLREHSISHYVCFAHQVNRSARYASGTGDFVENPNEDLSGVLNKMHEINSRITRSEKRLRILYEEQRRKNRKVIRKPFVGVVTRWNSDFLEVKATNIFMGDLQESLLRMLDEENGIDRHLVNESENGKDDFMFSPTERLTLRQYECAAEPIVQLSDFFQLSVPTAHLVLVTLRARIAEMRSPQFWMYGDISNSEVEVLTGRKKTELVGTEEVTANPVSPMLECIYDFRRIFADDIELRCKLKFHNMDHIFEDVERLPSDIAISCILHPLVGGKMRLVESGVMTIDQFDNAEKDLVERLQTMREAECGSRVLISKTTLGQRDELDDVYDQPISNEHQEAFNEWNNYCRVVKQKRHFPRKLKKDSNYLSVGSIVFGAVEERGDDLETEGGSKFKRCNIADFIRSNGYFDLIAFLGFNKEAFPFLYKLACCLASLRTNEVGCERFFSIAGYVSNPRRTKLNVKHYEMLAMLKRNMQQVYINEEFVVHEYMTHEKEKSWKTLDTKNDQLMTDLESNIFAEDLGVPLQDLPEAFQEDHGVDEVVEVPSSDSDTDTET